MCRRQWETSVSSEKKQISFLKSLWELIIQKLPDTKVKSVACVLLLKVVLFMLCNSFTLLPVNGYDMNIKPIQINFHFRKRTKELVKCAVSCSHLVHLCCTAGPVCRCAAVGFWTFIPLHSCIIIFIAMSILVFHEWAVISCINNKESCYLSSCVIVFVCWMEENSASSFILIFFLFNF